MVPMLTTKRIPLVAGGLAALIVACALVACSSSEETDDDGQDVSFDAADYDRACDAPEDCSVIFSGDPCGCSCDQAAIAASEREQVDADRAAHVEASCPEGPPE